MFVISVVLGLHWVSMLPRFSCYVSTLCLRNFKSHSLAQATPGRGGRRLGVKPAYRRRALETHPDKGGDPQCFLKVAGAFKVLSDPCVVHAGGRRCQAPGCRKSAVGPDYCIA